MTKTFQDKYHNFRCGVIRLFIVICSFVWVVPVSGQFVISSSVVPVTCAGGADGMITLGVTGGVSPYTYSWNPGTYTASLATGLSAGNYTITISDASAADSVLVVPVLEPSAVDDNPEMKNPLCVSNGYIALIPTGGSAPYTYLWNNGTTGQAINNLSPDNYQVTITDSLGCAFPFSYSLPEADCFVKPATYFTPNDDGYNDTWTIVNAQHFPNARLIIFDRWGTKVYDRRGTYEPWNGKSYLGLNVPDAVYYYFFYEDKDDKKNGTIRGSVTILR